MTREERLARAKASRLAREKEKKELPGARLHRNKQAEWFAIDPGEWDLIVKVRGQEQPKAQTFLYDIEELGEFIVALCARYNRLVGKLNATARMIRMERLDESQAPMPIREGD